MILCEYVTDNKKQFCEKVQKIADQLGIKVDWLMAVMYKESLISANARNPQSGAVGLIQFMPATAIDLGTTADALLNMSNVEQLDYVKKYFWRYRWKIKSYTDTYLAVFFPAAIGKLANYVLQTANLPAGLIAQQNAALDYNDDNKITVSEVERWALAGFIPEIQKILKKKAL